MSKDLRLLKKNVEQYTKDDLYNLIKEIREAVNEKTSKKQALEFAKALQLVLEQFSKIGDLNSERIILNQLFEIVWWAQEESEAIYILAQSISKVLIDSQLSRGENRTILFSDLTNILTKFPENKIIYDVISTASTELIKWAFDKEILEILEIIQERSVKYPLVEAIQLLNAKVFMNTLFYLMEENCKTIMDLYMKFSCFSIGSYDTSIDSYGKSHEISHIFGEDINEILQEGVINAIINMARINSKNEEGCEECLTNIRTIISDSEYLLRKEGKEFFKDIYRLSVTFDQFNLWDHFIDLPLVSELKIEREKNETYIIAEAKLLAIIKNMRIEEYDSLKVGRRGLVLEYDFNDLNDILRIAEKLRVQNKNSLKSIHLVSEVDALIETDDELTEHLREIGDIPSDKKTVDELQDINSKSDDLTKPAIKESKITEQMEFLKQLELTDDRFLINQLMHTKAMIYSVGMFGFNSPELQITPEDLISHINILCEKKMHLEIIDPLVRAVTLRAARLDGDSTLVLLSLLNKKGLKFLPIYYKQYNFIENLVRLISLLARQGQIELLTNVKLELEKSNRIGLDDDTLSLKIARAINGGILSFTAKDASKKLKLLELVKELAKLNSFEIDLQIKFVEALNFLILDVEHHTWKTKLMLYNELLEFSRGYRNNQLIVEKAALGLFWASLIANMYKQIQIQVQMLKEISLFTETYPSSSILQKITEFINSS
jgi:hypothetical protein